MEKQRPGAFEEYKENKIHWEQGSVLDLSWSSDGNLLTAAGSKGSVRSWRLNRSGQKDGEELKNIGSNIERLAWGPAAQNSDILAAASYDRSISLWDQRQGAVGAKLTTSGNNTDICWSPSGKYLATINRDEGKLEVFDVSQTQSPVIVADTEDIVCSVRWNPQESMLFLATDRGSVEVYQWPTMGHLTTIYGHAASCHCVEFDNCGTTMATGGADALVELWDTEDFSLKRPISGHESVLRYIGFSADGRYIASASDDTFIKIHETFSGELAHNLKVDSFTTTLEWHPRKLILACGTNGSSKMSIKPSVTLFLKPGV
ncbi:hypothetical protein LPJ73_001424 [Coemansia sp. RSA 2703]|nr:hypothetical protein LPJ73_001424 [Coemansia sp. RSA 2703]KAJ2395696.1 hypothetical protein GGI05_001464 [Coemansia sp. RSA 2603]